MNGLLTCWVFHERAHLSVDVEILLAGTEVEEVSEFHHHDAFLLPLGLTGVSNAGHFLWTSMCHE